MTESAEPPNGPAPENRAVSRTFVVAVRLLLLLAAAIFGMAALALAFADQSHEVDGARYVCPMHPEVRSARPEQCPICGMALEPATHGSAASARGPMLADLTAVENVRRHKVLDFVRLHALPIELRELRGAAWVEPDRRISALFYADQADSIAPGDEATFTPTETPEKSFAVQLSSDPKLPWEPGARELHFQLMHTARVKVGAPLTPGQVGWLELPRKPRSVLAVPADAILNAPEGPYVLRALGGFRFEQRSIEIAETFSKQGFAVLVSGLRAQDRVVARAAFFLDADRRMESQPGAGDPSMP